jgi:hypothetical protein
MTRSAHSPDQNNNNIIDFMQRKDRRLRKERKHLDASRVVRISPETDGLCILYSNSSSKDKLFSMNILCWALRQDGTVIAMIPWLNKLCPCDELQDPLEGHWEGYYDPETDEIFQHAPDYKAIELATAAKYFDSHQLQGLGSEHPHTCTQEITDTIGTHALLSGKHPGQLVLTEVFSWRLHADGEITAMLINGDLVTTTPVLTGDNCLYEASSDPEFRYYFQHHIANQIKAEDPIALAAVAMLIEP